jgi:hypothetical protein
MIHRISSLSHTRLGTKAFRVSEFFRNQQVNSCLSSWVGGQGDRDRPSPFMIEQKDEVKRCTGVQEYVTLNVLNVETQSKAELHKIL